MDLVIWTKDEDTGDLVPYHYGEVAEARLTVTCGVDMRAKDGTITIKEKDKSLCI